MVVSKKKFNVNSSVCKIFFLWMEDNKFTYDITNKLMERIPNHWERFKVLIFEREAW